MLHNEPSPIPRRWSRPKVLALAVVIGVLVALGLLVLRASRPSATERQKTSPVEGK